jgi:excinuclease ABC subunit C
MAPPPTNAPPPEQAAGSRTATPVTDLTRKAASLPEQPGVYWFKGHRGEVLYVGKARRLRDRVRSHFQDPAAVGPKQVALVRRVADVDFLAVDSEIDALVLEATLIREHKPPYNVALKDDKRYPYLKVTWQEPYPRLLFVRRIERDGARYFGPYVEVKALRRLLRTTRTVFPMRSCTDIETHIAAHRECLDYHIGRCTGPCIGAQSQAEYRAMAARFCDFLAGKREGVVAELRALQETAAERREYERAGRLRDQIRGLSAILERQRMIDVGQASTDVLGVARSGGRACAVVLKVRERRVVSRDVRWLKGAQDHDEAELLRAVIPLYYADAPDVPERVLADAMPGERDLLERFLARSSEAPVRVRPPRDAAERALVRLARRNAALQLLREDGARDGRPGRVTDEALELQRALGLTSPPRRIRCFDVSTLFGRDSVASMVTFVDGAPYKAEYRRFRIRAVPGQDDFASMEEAVGRHAERVARGEFPAADLLLIDGGPGQLGAARKAARGTPLETVPAVGLMKRLEEIALPERREPLRLPRRSAGLKLLQRVRDEAHRFAIEYHRTLRERRARVSLLEQVPGLGPTRRAELLRRFGSVERLRREPPEAIASVPGIGPRMAARIVERMRRAGEEEAS